MFREFPEQKTPKEPVIGELDWVLLKCRLEGLIVLIASRHLSFPRSSDFKVQQ
jgi:hypothetical protein